MDSLAEELQRLIDKRLSNIVRVERERAEEAFAKERAELKARIAFLVGRHCAGCDAPDCRGTQA